MITEVLDVLPRAEIEDLMVRGQHPTTAISWYAPIVIVGRDESGQVVGAITAKPGHFGRRSRMPGWLRVADIILDGSMRTRLRNAITLTADLRAWARAHGYRHGFVALRKGRPWTDSMRALLPRIGGTKDTEGHRGEIWSWWNL